MIRLLKYLAILIIISCQPHLLNAQSSEELYASTDANLVEEEGPVRNIFLLKEAAVSLPNGTEALQVFVTIPDTLINFRAINMSDPISKGYLLSLNIKIDPNLIQQELTSLKTFKTHGVIEFNDITRNIEVEYMPMESGLEENGNFNIFISFRVNPSDFGLSNTTTKRFLLSICIIPL